MLLATANAALAVSNATLAVEYNVFWTVQFDVSEAELLLAVSYAELACLNAEFDSLNAEFVVKKLELTLAWTALAKR